MKIALLGTRGIPSRYGGFETFAEELSWRLVERGHEVTVYCREKHAERRYRGVDLVWLPPVRHKYLETVLHTFASTLHLLFHRHDVALYCNAANAIFTFLPRITGTPVAINVDGMERKRKKWNWLGKLWYLVSERIATWFPTAVISDARHIAEYYRTRYGLDTWFISYGADAVRLDSTEVLQQTGLQPGEYFLYVSRMEPENNALLVRECFEKVKTELKLALVGDAPYARDYIEKVRNTNDPRVVMPGAIFGRGYQELQSHCFAYIHATEVGGTHPALVEAMGRGALVLYLNTPENAEVAGDAGIPFEPYELTARLEQVLAMSRAERKEFSDRASARVREKYSWDAVTTAYEDMLAGLLRPNAVAEAKKPSAAG